HCDVNQEDTLANIRYAIEDLRVDRIDHGGNIVESPDLMALAKARNLFFTVCPTFSGTVRTGGQPVDVVRKMLDNGLNLSINSDDPAYMGSEYITDVLIKAQAQSGLTKAELVQIERNGFTSAWISPARRDRLLARLDAFARTWGVG
ncbi:MAG: adenosine deaminase, partial [bacterium]|nr:adenosine deaminase [bacterium]